MRRSVALLLTIVAGLILVAVAYGTYPTEQVRLVDFDFRELVYDPLAPAALAEPNWGLHWLAEGWDATPDSARGIWAYGPEASALVQLIGRNATLRLVASTRPDLSAAGQAVEVLLNDHVLGRLPLRSGWKDHAWEVAVPPGVLRRGSNRLTLRPEQWSQEASPHAVYLRELSVTADLNRIERWAWNRRLSRPEPDEDRALGFPDPKRAPDPVASNDRPDILFVLFDATRASHVGCYGYERSTTPNVDALAAEGVVMRRCFAESPFTIISVPTILTGRHWSEHGVFGAGQRLSGSFTTLAEVLAEAGYLTIGYSGNPFVSRRTNLSQGFAEFTELWNDPAFEGTGWSAELAERRFLERARAGLGDRPVFAYLHLMPPHSPYRPGPEHDLWTDPDYGGVYKGSAGQLNRIEDEGLVVSEADRKQITALYDGNLHRIDASLGRILAGWRALQRSRELLIVFVSDHGEAFGEHGHWQHLSTVYDEMTRVPLVLWPREAWADLIPARDQVASVADLFPMLLRHAGIPLPTDRPWTRRARALHAGASVGPAEVIIRTTLHARTYGLRTSGYLAVFDGFTDQGLYDLETDPGARRNLRGEKPDLYSAMLGRMRSALEQYGPTERSVYEPTPEEIEVLRSLGY